MEIDMLLELQGGIIYGPVQSRRLGRSLGINVLPARVKLCAFDCLYCQYGWTGAHALAPDEGTPLATAADILEAVRSALVMIDSPPSYITFSGNGEPTLHPEFPSLVDGVTALRDRYSPGSRTAVLSNSATAADPLVRGTLARLDLRIMKLDAGTDEMFRRFNRPCADVTFAAVVEGLKAIEDITIQALFAGGEMGNADADHIGAWVDVIAEIRPTMVQVYTLARGYPSRGIEPLAKSALLVIARKLDAKGIRANVF
jgi:wyosine [tRNA(Phe)-imidazoG37] synthetase (radical SAM superfamily)